MISRGISIQTRRFNRQSYSRFIREGAYTSWNFYRVSYRRVSLHRSQATAGFPVRLSPSLVQPFLSSRSQAAFIVGLPLSRVSMVRIAGARRQWQGGRGGEEGADTEGEEDALMREIKGLKAVKTSSKISPNRIHRFPSSPPLVRQS